MINTHSDFPDGLLCSVRFHDWINNNPEQLFKFGPDFSDALIYSNVYCPQNIAYLIQDSKVVKKIVIKFLYKNQTIRINLENE